ncbi:MAG: hypothetical protein ACW98I_16445 [Candidatus Hodarchaeales archaeon]
MIDVKIQYLSYEKNAGLEELQAQIYNTNHPDSPTVKAEEITKRFEKEKIDPKTVRYALSETGSPLAYVQARDYPESKETHLGYPWALPDCPAEVQNKIFDEMLAYIQTRDVGYEIQVNVSANRKEQIEFVKAKSELEEKNRSYRREIDVHKISEMTPEKGDYTIRKATIDDVEILVQLIKGDGRYASQFSDDGEVTKYFSERVLPDNHCYLVFKADKLVRATAPLITKLPSDTEERLILRFHSYLPNTEEAFKAHMIAIAKECVKAGLDSKPLSLYESPDDSDAIKNVLKEFKPINTEIQGYTYGLKE